MFLKLLREKIRDLREAVIISRRLVSLLWGYDKKLFIAHALAISLPAIIPFINAYIYKLIIDLIVTSINHPFNYQSLYVLLGMRFASLLLQYFATSVQGFTELLIWSRMPIYIYQLVLGKLATLDVEYFENSRFRDSLQRVKEGYAYMPLNMFSNVFYTFQSLLQLTIAFFALATLNITLAFGIIAAALPGFLNQLYFSKTLWGVWAENSPYRKKFWYLSELIQDRQGIKEMKIFGTAGRFLSEITTIQKKLATENFRVGKIRLRNSFILNFFGTLIYIFIEGFIALLTISGKITLGSLSYFSFVILNFENGVSGFFSNLSRIFDQSLYVKDIFAVLDMPAKITTAPRPVKIAVDKPPKIEFRNVTFAYPSPGQSPSGAAPETKETKIKVLKNFSLVIEPGEKVAFVGENGAGKTTIVKLLARFYDVSEGEILINGHNIKNIDLESWYKCLGVIFQDFIKYEYTLGENIHFGKIYEPFSQGKIETAASMAGVDSIARTLEKGYDQMLGLTFEGGIELSLGQWQKVALARAFLRDAPVLVLDEPTASIDAKSEKEIFDKVERLGRDKTVIIISHRFSTVRNADKIYVIKGGRIVEDGSHKKLLAERGIYAKLFNIQAEGYK